MANLVMGALGNLVPKLYELLKEEYKLQTGVKERIRSLTEELEVAQAALCKVAEVPWDQLDKQVQIWTRQVREASYDMEDVLDTFLVRVKGLDSAEQEESLLKPLKKMANLFKKSKARRKISGDVKHIMTHLEEVTNRCRRYKVDDIVARPATVSTVDPRLHAMYTQVNKLVAIDESSGELMSKLQLDDMASTKMKTVSVVGIGGLGKTTLAKAVYDKIKGDFGCTAFVLVGRNPDLKKIFKDILIDLNRPKYLNFSTAALDERQLIDELRMFLLENNTRYLIIIDDIWEIESWQTIKLAIDDDKNYGGRVIITTRKMEVATKVDEVYKLQPLPYDSSRELLYARTYGHEEMHIDSQLDEISNKFIRKCGGIPLAIITMASLLAGKPRDKWSKLYDTIDFGSKDNKEAENTMMILSFSYYDLPAHLRTCMLYLSAFPEDSVIDKDPLVWKWIAEGFVQENVGISLFETGERYFNDLINRCMIQAVESYKDDSIVGCRVHDVVLDFIRSMSREELFFTVVDTNDQDTLLQSNVRRLAIHSSTNGLTHEIDHSIPKLRSFFALSCVIEKWVPVCNFTLLRVLAIENCRPRDGDFVRVEHLGHLLHLRYLSLRGTWINGIPEEIGALRFLQTLDVLGSEISALPSTCSSLKQLACLRVSLMGGDVLDGKVFSLEGMTSLEELVLVALDDQARRRLLKSLGCLRELRVLKAVVVYDNETQRDLVESLRHLHKLQSLEVDALFMSTPESSSYYPSWQATGLSLSCHLRHLTFSEVEFCILPSCISPECVPNLTCLDLWVHDVDEQDLKTLGGLPELRSLGLKLSSSASATIHNIRDSDACYFPKLRRFRMESSMVLFVVAKKGGKQSISFHIWNGEDDNGIVPFDSDDELESSMPSVSDDEMERSMHSVFEDELQSFMADDEELPRRPIIQKLQQVMVSVAFYLVAIFQLILAFIKRWSISNSGSTPAPYGEVAIAKASASDGDGLKNVTSICSKGTAAPPFMQSLQVLEFAVRQKASENHPNCCDNPCLEYLSSLQQINVVLWNSDAKDRVEAALRRTAKLHPNHPTLRIKLRSNEEPY